MNYKFPTIQHIDDVLPHIEGDNSFVVARKDGYTAIDYVVVTSDSFRPLTGDSENDLRSMVRRECRGLIFCNDTGKLIRRPFHKFFNIGEREETLIANLSLDRPFIVLEKLDGSMIAPFITSDNVFRVGTKMGETDIAVSAYQYMVDNKYVDFCKEVIMRGCTPIFEWMSPHNRVVLDYGPNPKLTLLAVRHMVTGEYQFLPH